MNAVEKTILMDNVSTSKSSKRRAKNRKQSQQNQNHNKTNNHHQSNKEHETNLKVENDNGESEQIVHQKLIDFLDVRTKGRLEDHNHILTQYQDLCTQKAREEINELSRNYITVLNDCNDANIETGSAIKSKPKEPEVKSCNRTKNSKKGNKTSLSNGSEVGDSLQIQGNSIETNILSKNVFRPIKDNVDETHFYHENCYCSNGDVKQIKSAESSPHSNSSCSCSSGNSGICNKTNTNNKKTERKKSKLKNFKATTATTTTKISETLTEELNETTSQTIENNSNFCSTNMNGHSNDCNDSLSDVSCEGAVGYGPDTDHDYDKCSFYDARRNNGIDFVDENCDGKLKNGNLNDNSSCADGEITDVINKFNNNVSYESNRISQCDPNDNVSVENTSLGKSLEMNTEQEQRNNEESELLPKIESPECSSLAPISIEDCRREDGSLDPSKVVIEYKEYESELQMQDIMRLIQKELSEPYSIYTYRYFIYNWPKLCFLAAHGNEYVGAIVCKLDMHMNVKRGYIAMLAVKKEYRKMKIGTNLVQKAIEAMLADDAAEVVLETEMKNIPALRLYENLGFVRDKRLFRYYLNGVDALRLKLWFR